MNRSIFVFIGCFLLFSTAYSQQNRHEKGKTVILADTSVNFGWGLYKVCPILNHDEKVKTMKKINALQKEVAEHEQKIAVAKDSLALKMDADTVFVRRHTTFFGGLFTIPKLTENESQALKARKKNADEKARIIKEEQKLKKLKLKIKNLKNLLELNEKKLRKSYLWGFGITHKDRIKKTAKK
jgi:hypothetical protein